MQYEIKVDGRNDVVEVVDGMIVRTSRKVLGKDDVLRIPLSKVTGIDVDRQMVRADIVTLKVGHERHEWKMSDAEAFAAEVMAALD